MLEYKLKDLRIILTKKVMILPYTTLQTTVIVISPLHNHSKSTYPNTTTNKLYSNPTLYPITNTTTYIHKYKLISANPNQIQFHNQLNQRLLVYTNHIFTVGRAPGTYALNPKTLTLSKISDSSSICLPYYYYILSLNTISTIHLNTATTASYCYHNLLNILFPQVTSPSPPLLTYIAQPYPQLAILIQLSGLSKVSGCTLEKEYNKYTTTPDLQISPGWIIQPNLSPKPDPTENCFMTVRPPTTVQVRN